MTIWMSKLINVKVNYETIMIAPLEIRVLMSKVIMQITGILTIIDDHGNYISDKI